MTVCLFLEKIPEIALCFGVSRTHSRAFVLRVLRVWCSRYPRRSSATWLLPLLSWLWDAQAHLPLAPVYAFKLVCLVSADLRSQFRNVQQQWGAGHSVEVFYVPGPTDTRRVVINHLQGNRAWGHFSGHCLSAAKGSTSGLRVRDVGAASCLARGLADHLPALKK